MSIVRLCCKFLKSQLRLENCIGIWRHTGYYYCPNPAYGFIFHHFKEMTKLSTEFLVLSVKELKHITEKDELSMKQEGATFEATLKWILMTYRTGGSILLSCWAKLVPRHGHGQSWAHGS